MALRKYEEDTKKVGGTVRRQFVIGTSSDTDRRSTDLAIAAGMDVFLAKPFTPSDLKLFVSVNPNTNLKQNQIDRRIEELPDEDDRGDRDEFSL